MAKFTPRTTPPEVGEKWFTHYDNGGLSICKKIDTKTGFTCPNCVGWAYGRIMQLLNATKPDWKLPAGNAEDWITIAIQNKWPGNYGNKPKLGAAIVWSQGKKNTSSDGAGHVAIVERINQDGTLLVSESAYNGYLFKTETVPADYTRAGMKFEGFVYCGIEFEEDITPTEDYSKSTTPERFKVVKSGKQIGSYTSYDLAVKYAQEKGAVVTDGKGGPVIWPSQNEQPAPKPTTQAKKQLTATSYPNYKNGSNEYYRVRKSYNDGASSVGSFYIFASAFSRWNTFKNSGYHIYDKNGKQLD